MRKSVLILFTIGLFLSEGICENAIEWDYFLTEKDITIYSEGVLQLLKRTKRIPVGKSITKIYNTAIDHRGNKVVVLEKVKNLNNLKFISYTTYLLDTDTNQIKEVGVRQTSDNPLFNMEFDYRDYPNVVLEYPLKIGKKWTSLCKYPENTIKMLKMTGVFESEFYTLERTVTKKKTLSVGDEKYEVFVIREVLIVNGKRSDVTYYYYHKDYGEIAKGYYDQRGIWQWVEKAYKIVDEKKEERERKRKLSEQASKQRAEHYIKGLRFLKNGKYEEALEQFNIAVTSVL